MLFLVKPVFDFLFVMWCIIRLEVSIRRWLSVAMLERNNTQFGYYRTQSVPRKHSSPHYTPGSSSSSSSSRQSGLLTRGRLGSWFRAVDARLWPDHLQPQRKSRLIGAGCVFSLHPSSLGESVSPQPPIPPPVWEKWNESELVNKQINK